MLELNNIFFYFSWNKLLSYIWSDDGPVNLLYGDKLRDKDRALIKERFAVSIIIMYSFNFIKKTFPRVLIKKLRR